MIEKVTKTSNERPRITSEYVVVATPGTEFDMPMSVGSDGQISWESFNAEIFGELHDIPRGCTSLPKGTAFNVFFHPGKGVVVKAACHEIYETGKEGKNIIIAHIITVDGAMYLKEFVYTKKNRMGSMKQKNNGQEV